MAGKREREKVNPLTDTESEAKREMGHCMAAPWHSLFLHHNCDEEHLRYTQNICKSAKSLEP